VSVDQVGASHFESLAQVYEERFGRQYGFFRPYVQQVIYRYLDCGDLHTSFARVNIKVERSIGTLKWGYQFSWIRYLGLKKGIWSFISMQWHLI